MLSFFLRGVLNEILNLIESVSKGFPSYSYQILLGLFILPLCLYNFESSTSWPSILHLPIFYILCENIN